MTIAWATIKSHNHGGFIVACFLKGRYDMAKKSRNIMGDKDKRFVHEVFDAAIRYARKNNSNPNALKIYDLTGPILKRRKKSVYNLLPEVKNRFGTLYDGDNGILDAWGHECSAMCHSIDGADHLYYITLASAIFMLDELKHSGKLGAATRYFNKDQESLMSVSLPDIYDPCHDQIVLRGMVELIRERDPRDNHFQCFINDVSAQRIEPVVHQAPEQSQEELSPRARFNAVMDMIHPAVKERAIKRFEEKFWEFLKIFFECDAPLYNEQVANEQKIESLMAECMNLNDKIVDARKVKPKQSPPKCILIPQAAPSTNEFSNIGSSFSLNKTDKLAINDMDFLQMKATKGLELEDRVAEINKKRLAIVLFAHVTQMIKCEEAIDNLGETTAEKFMRFEVNDPYETCFGYLCLIEAGSDIPWTYNAALAVLMAAARKLPWNAYAIEQQEELENECDDEDADLEHLHERVDADYSERGNLIPLDWNEKKADLYRLNYLSKPLYAPLDAPSPNWKMNIPQLIFGLTGLVMPRVVSDSADMAEEFAAAGVEEGVAKGLELYLQLALDLQNQSRDWRHGLQSSSFSYLEGLDLSRPNLDDKEDDVEDLKAKLKQLKEANADFREALYRAQKEIETVKEDAANVEAQAAAERTELAELRELAFRQANANEIELPETEESVADQFPYDTRKRVVVFGGHDTWLKAIRPMLPNVTFVNREQRPNADMIKAADVVWIQANALSHRSFYKIINVVRTNQVPIRYFGYSSAMKCAVQVLEDDA